MAVAVMIFLLCRSNAPRQSTLRGHAVRVHSHHFPDIAVGVVDAAVVHEGVILSRVGIGAPARRRQAKRREPSRRLFA